MPTTVEDAGPIFLTALFAIYMTPAVAAIINKRSDWPVLTLANLFLGWSGIVWLLVLIFATRKDAVTKAAEQRAAEERIAVLTAQAVARATAQSRANHADGT